MFPHVIATPWPGLHVCFAWCIPDMHVQVCNKLIDRLAKRRIIFFELKRLACGRISILFRRLTYRRTRYPVQKSCLGESESRLEGLPRRISILFRTFAYRRIPSLFRRLAYSRIPILFRGFTLEKVPILSKGLPIGEFLSCWEGLPLAEFLSCPEVGLQENLYTVQKACLQENVYPVQKARLHENFDLVQKACLKKNPYPVNFSLPRATLSCS